MAIKLTASPKTPAPAPVATADVVTSASGAVTSTQTENLPVEGFEPVKQAATYAMVGVGFGLTVNIGNFESVRMDVSLQVPCADDAVDETFPAVKGWVEDKLNAMAEELRATQEAQS
jgi:hypothetical protein